MAWTPSAVTTVDGRTLMSDSEDWRAYCEAMVVLKSQPHIAENRLVMIEKMRGKAGRALVQAECDRLEPAYMLSLPDKATRQAHLQKIGDARGVSARAALEVRIVALWNERKAAETAKVSAA